MATGTRSLPTDSPIPYFQQLERGHMSEGVPSDIGSLGDVPCGGMQMPPHSANLSEVSHIPPGGIEYHPIASESDILSTYTGLDDYDTLFEARHGRGALDNMPRTSREMIVTPSIGTTPMALSVGVIENQMVRIRPIPDSGPSSTNQKEHVSASADPSMMGHRAVSLISSGHIIGEGAVIFTDMTEIMLTALDQQMTLSREAQKPAGSLTNNVLTSGQIIGSSKVGESQTRLQTAHDTKDIYPDLYLPVAENYKISDQFYGYMDSTSTDNNQMILGELTGLSYRYGTSIYAVDRENRTIYGKFSVGYRVINEKSTVKPQFRPTSLEDENTIMPPTYANTLPGTTSMVTPLAKSTPITQTSQMSTIPTVLPHVGGLIEPASNEQARAAYLERQMKDMGSVRIPSDIPSLEDGVSLGPESLPK